MKLLLVRRKSLIKHQRLLNFLPLCFLLWSFCRCLILQLFSISRQVSQRLFAASWCILGSVVFTPVETQTGLCLFQLRPAAVSTAGHGKLDPVLSRGSAPRPTAVCPKLRAALRLTGARTRTLIPQWNRPSHWSSANLLLLFLSFFFQQRIQFKMDSSCSLQQVFTVSIVPVAL